MLGRNKRQNGKAITGRKVEGTLSVLRPGEHAVIAEIPDDRARAQALRFGMGVGAPVLCVCVIPGGPVVLRSGRQEIAVGRGLARSIRIGGMTGAPCGAA